MRRIQAEKQDRWQQALRMTNASLPVIESARIAVLVAARVGGKGARLLRVARVLGAGSQVLLGARSLIHAHTAWQSRRWEYVASHGAAGLGYFLCIAPGGVAVGSVLVTGSTVYQWARLRQSSPERPEPVE